MGIVYRMSRDVRLLNQMIRFCDASLSERNDLASAPFGQRLIWTGRIDPVWPNNFTNGPLSTGGEQGDMVGNLGNCAVRILQTPSLWTKSVPDGDPHHYGVTYLARVKIYVKQGDISVDDHILKSLLDLTHENRQYFSETSPYKGGRPVPWNQQMMFDYAFQYLAAAHMLLGDDPARVKLYRRIVQNSVNWLFSTGVETYTDKDGNPAYNWGYAMPSTHGEDATHAGMDVAGFYWLYQAGEYSITRGMMAPFANTFVDVMTIGRGVYAGRVDGISGSGHASTTKEVRSGYLLMAAFRPDAYFKMCVTDLTEEGTTENLDLFSRFLWVNNLRFRGGTKE